MNYPLDCEGYVSLEPLAPPTAPAYKTAVELARAAGQAGRQQQQQQQQQQVPP
jgi:hypothetical protein